MATPQRISSSELRRLFNDLGYWEKACAGEFRQVVVKDRHPSPERSHQPICTRSQMISYRDREDNEVARVHQYLRPDGTLGGSGKPDPKRLIHKGIVYFAGPSRRT